MASRRRGREYALQMMFQWDISKDSPDRVVESFWASRQRNVEEFEDEGLRLFADELFLGTVESVEEIDRSIRQRAEHWRLERMAAVDRNILRLAIYEITHHRDTPNAVVINEALEIARKFSEEESVSFINGLLDAIRQETESLHSN
jgi:N utilization substance protein B